MHFTNVKVMIILINLQNFSGNIIIYYFNLFKNLPYTHMESIQFLLPAPGKQKYVLPRHFLEMKT